MGVRAIGADRSVCPYIPWRAAPDHRPGRYGRTPSGMRGYDNIGVSLRTSRLHVGPCQRRKGGHRVRPYDRLCRIDAQHGGGDHYIKVSGRAILLPVTKGLPPGHVPPVILQAGLRREGNTGTRTPRMTSASALQADSGSKSPCSYGVSVTATATRATCAGWAARTASNSRWDVGVAASGPRRAMWSMVCHSLSDRMGYV